MTGTAGSKTKYIVTKADQTTVEVSATRVDDDNGQIRFYDGDDLIAKFAGAQSFHPA